MAHIVEISDGVLINNLYRMLYNELGKVGFRDIFVKIGVASKIEKGEIPGTCIRDYRISEG